MLDKVNATTNTALTEYLELAGVRTHQTRSIRSKKRMLLPTIPCLETIEHGKNRFGVQKRKMTTSMSPTECQPFEWSKQPLEGSEDNAKSTVGSVDAHSSVDFRGVP